MKEQEFKELVEKTLHVLEGYAIDENGNKKMHIVGIEKLYKQLTLQGVVASLPKKKERSYREWVEDECIDLKNGELIYKEKRYSEEKIWQKWYYDDI